MSTETSSIKPLLKTKRFNDKGITYAITSATTVKVVPHKYTYYTGDIKIPDTVIHRDIEYHITEISDLAFLGNKHITSVSIGNHVTSIKAFTFSKCKNLSTITLSNRVTTIEKYAFSFSGLTHFTFPKLVTTISPFLFISCEQLKTVTIPKTITDIKDYAFSWCSNLSSINCNIKAPLTMPTNVFTGTNTQDCHLMVSSHSLKNYKLSPIWKEFNVIKQIKTTTTSKNTTMSKMSVYPKSVQNKLFIEFFNANEAMIEIFNENGQVLLHQTKTSKQNSINTSNLPMGMYWVKLTSNKGTTTEKIFKN